MSDTGPPISPLTGAEAASLLLKMPSGSRPAAQEIIKAPALPAPGAASGPARALPLTRLQRLPLETSMLYGIGRVDSSGRVANREIIEALHWQPGDGLETVLTPSAIVTRGCPDGPDPDIGHRRVRRAICYLYPAGPASPQILADASGITGRE
jgi:hypothetical protein